MNADTLFNKENVIAMQSEAVVSGSLHELPHGRWEFWVKGRQNPPLAKHSQVKLNLLTTDNEACQNFAATLIGLEARDDHWVYRLKWNR